MDVDSPQLLPTELGGDGCTVDPNKVANPDNNVGAPDGSATKTQESTKKNIMPAWLNVLLLDLARWKEGQLQPCLSRGQQVQDCTSAAVSATIWLQTNAGRSKQLEVG